MDLNERKARIVARGEISDHSHIVTGDAVVTRNEAGELLISVGNEGAVMRHLLESAWLNGTEVWTTEHDDIALSEGTYTYVPQMEFDPFEKKIREITD